MGGRALTLRRGDAAHDGHGRYEGRPGLRAKTGSASGRSASANADAGADAGAK